MSKLAKKLWIAFLFSSAFSFAQEAMPPVEMADGMRSSGKIYVVVAVVMIVLLGLITYLITIDRKVSKLEKEVKE